MKSKSKERLPERVPFAAIPVGEMLNMFTQAGMPHLGTETKDLAQWAHRLVWTDRMLETLLIEQPSERRQMAHRNERWPNAYLTEHGFWWSLREAHFHFAQSCN